MRISEANKISETFEFDFENSLPKGIFGQNIRDLPNGSLTADPRSSQAASLKVTRYSFPGPIPPKFEHKLRRHKLSFEKIATKVVLDKDENLL